MKSRTVLLQCSGLTKRYPARRYGSSIRERVAVWKKRAKERGSEQIQALSDVTISLTAGQVVGVVGRNGSGKSTLLRILAGISEPTSGEVKVSGRPSALLEVGAGFHPELSGWENIRLYAGLRGIRMQEVRSRMSDIIGISQLDSELSRPMKYLNTGSFLRLGFSAVMSLARDIVILDEVTSVADLSFQKVIAERVRHFAQNGGLVVLTSHDLERMSETCDRVLWLYQGSMVDFGDTKKILSEYRTNHGIKKYDASLAEPF